MKALDRNAIALLVGGLLLGVVLTSAGVLPVLARSEQQPASFPTDSRAPIMSTNGMIGCMGGMGGMGMGMGSMGLMREVDRHFIEMMVPHHQTAIEMADLALQKAQHEELKALAADIKRVQAQEIERMREWYRRWYGMDLPNVTNMPARPGNGMMGSGMMGGQNMMGMMSDGSSASSGQALDELKNAADFDKAFITLMVPHHRMALMMSNMVIMSGEHEELRALARSIITSQSAEIERMEEWRTAWYGQ